MAPKKALKKEKASVPVRRLTQEEAGRLLVGYHGLAQRQDTSGLSGTKRLLNQMRCIQLDPLDVIGTNADLVALARVDGIKRGDIYRGVFPRHAFEHFAKERCLLPAYAFPWYREQMAETPWWRLSERLKRIPETLIAEVLAEVRERGPVTPSALTHRGLVKPLDWNGWKGTGKATSMALEVLWTRCHIVVAGRSARGKIYDVPERALPSFETFQKGDFRKWALLERAAAAGLLSRLSGPLWSMLSDVRTSTLPDELLESGELELVEVEGGTRRYLSPRGWVDNSFPDADGNMRILGPLDPLIWDRDLVRTVFSFDYVWEVYKPESTRRWGWYVCPLLQGNRLVGRIEAAVKGSVLKVEKIWKENKISLDETALDVALERHAQACGAERFTRPRRFLKT